MPLPRQFIVDQAHAVGAVVDQQHTKRRRGSWVRSRFAAVG
jgi:hypothetical protein